jgi:hypothetical protein
MSDNDLIRRGDALALMRHDPFLIGVREDLAGMAPDEDGDWVSFHAIAALPAVDPLADPRVKALVEALADVYRLHMRRGPAWDHEPTKEVMDRAAAALAAFKGGEA